MSQYANLKAHMKQESIKWDTVMQQVPQNNFHDYFDTLENLGHNLRKLDSYNRNMLMAYVLNARPINNDVCMFLIHKGSKPSQVDQDGNSVLHHAAYNPTLPLATIHLLAKEGCAVDSVNNNGANVLMIYLKNKHPVSLPVVEYLLQSGASATQVDCEGASTLHYAVSNPSLTVDVLELLLGEEADVNRQTCY